jgi:hypothetical protein
VEVKKKKADGTDRGKTGDGSSESPAHRACGIGPAFDAASEKIVRHREEALFMPSLVSWKVPEQL